MDNITIKTEESTKSSQPNYKRKPKIVKNELNADAKNNFSTNKIKQLVGIKGSFTDQTSFLASVIQVIFHMTKFSEYLINELALSEADFKFKLLLSLQRVIKEYYSKSLTDCNNNISHFNHFNNFASSVGDRNLISIDILRAELASIFHYRRKFLPGLPEDPIDTFFCFINALHSKQIDAALHSLVDKSCLSGNNETSVSSKCISHELFYMKVHRKEICSCLVTNKQVYSNNCFIIDIPLIKILEMSILLENIIEKNSLDNLKIENKDLYEGIKDTCLYEILRNSINTNSNNNNNNNSTNNNNNNKTIELDECIFNTTLKGLLFEYLKITYIGKKSVCFNENNILNPKILEDNETTNTNLCKNSKNKASNRNKETTDEELLSHKIKSRKLVITNTPYYLSFSLEDKKIFLNTRSFYLNVLKSFLLIPQKIKLSSIYEIEDNDSSRDDCFYYVCSMITRSESNYFSTIVVNSNSNISNNNDYSFTYYNESIIQQFSTYYELLQHCIQFKEIPIIVFYSKNEETNGHLNSIRDMNHVNSLNNIAENSQSSNTHSPAIPFSISNEEVIKLFKSIKNIDNLTLILENKFRVSEEEINSELDLISGSTFLDTNYCYNYQSPYTNITKSHFNNSNNNNVLLSHSEYNNNNNSNQIDNNTLSNSNNNSNNNLTSTNGFNFQNNLFKNKFKRHANNNNSNATNINNTYTHSNNNNISNTIISNNNINNNNNYLKTELHEKIETKINAAIIGQIKQDNEKNNNNNNRDISSNSNNYVFNNNYSNINNYNININKGITIKLEKSRQEKTENYDLNNNMENARNDRSLDKKSSDNAITDRIYNISNIKNNNDNNDGNIDSNNHFKSKSSNSKGNNTDNKSLDNNNTTNTANTLNKHNNKLSNITNTTSITNSTSNNNTNNNNLNSTTKSQLPKNKKQISSNLNVVNTTLNNYVKNKSTKFKKEMSNNTNISNDGLEEKKSVITNTKINIRTHSKNNVIKNISKTRLNTNTNTHTSNNNNNNSNYSIVNSSHTNNTNTSYNTSNKKNLINKNTSNTKIKTNTNKIHSMNTEIVENNVNNNNKNDGNNNDDNIEITNNNESPYTHNSVLYKSKSSTKQSADNYNHNSNYNNNYINSNTNNVVSQYNINNNLQGLTPKNMSNKTTSIISKNYILSLPTNNNNNNNNSNTNMGIVSSNTCNTFNNTITNDENSNVVNSNFIMSDCNSNQINKEYISNDSKILNKNESSNSMRLEFKLKKFNSTTSSSNNNFQEEINSKTFHKHNSVVEGNTNNNFNTNNGYNNNNSNISNSNLISINSSNINSNNNTNANTNAHTNNSKIRASTIKTQSINLLQQTPQIISQNQQISNKNPNNSISQQTNHNSNSVNDQSIKERQSYSTDKDRETQLHFNNILNSNNNISITNITNNSNISTSNREISSLHPHFSNSLPCICQKASNEAKFQSIFIDNICRLCGKNKYERLTKHELVNNTTINANNQSHSMNNSNINNNTNTNNNSNLITNNNTTIKKSNNNFNRNNNEEVEVSYNNNNNNNNNNFSLIRSPKNKKEFSAIHHSSSITSNNYNCKDNSAFKNQLQSRIANVVGASSNTNSAGNANLKNNNVLISNVSSYLVDSEKLKVNSNGSSSNNHIKNAGNSMNQDVGNQFRRAVKNEVTGNSNITNSNHINSNALKKTSVSPCDIRNSNINTDINNNRNNVSNNNANTVKETAKSPINKNHNIQSNHIVHNNSNNISKKITPSHSIIMNNNSNTNNNINTNTNNNTTNTNNAKKPIGKGMLVSGKSNISMKKNNLNTNVNKSQHIKK